VERVKALLAGFDVRGRLHLQHLGSSLLPGDGLLRQVIVTDARGDAYTASLDRQGRVVSILRQRGSGERAVFAPSIAGPFDRPIDPSRRAAIEQRLRRWSAAAGTREPVRLAPLSVDRNGAVGHAYFAILRNGHPFVSHPRFGYDFTFAAATGAFLSFHAQENPPPVDPRPARLDKTGALAALRRIWDTDVAPQALHQRGWRRVWYTLQDGQGTPELGYYLPEGGRRAILVWKVRFWSYRDVGHAIQGGSDAMLIDAITGERVATKTVP